MISNISAATVVSSRVAGDADAQGKIKPILAQIKDMRRQVTALLTRLAKATDPGARKVLINAITEVERTVVLLQQQIAMIESSEQRKSAARQQAAMQQAQEPARNNKQ